MDKSLENCDVSEIAKGKGVSEDIEYCAGDICCTTNTLKTDKELTTTLASDCLSDVSSHNVTQSCSEDSSDEKACWTERDTDLKISNLQVDVEGSSKGDETDSCTVGIPLNGDSTPSVPDSRSNDSNLPIIPKQNYSYG